jgi:hypothetical protein
MKKFIAILSMVVALAACSTAQANLIGNTLSARANGSDGAADVMQVYFNAPIPFGLPLVNSFNVWDEGQGGSFVGFI